MFKFVYIYRMFIFYLSFNLFVKVIMQRTKKCKIGIECKLEIIISRKTRINKYIHKTVQGRFSVFTEI